MAAKTRKICQYASAKEVKKSSIDPSKLNKVCNFPNQEFAIENQTSVITFCMASLAFEKS